MGHVLSRAILTRRLVISALMLLAAALPVAIAAEAPTPDSLTESSAASWAASADGGSAAVYDEAVNLWQGTSCLRLETDGGADVRMWAPAERDAHWDLTEVQDVTFAAYANVPSIGFQNDVPWVRLGTSESDYIEIRSNTTALNECVNQWHVFVVPIAGDADWTADTFGTPDLADINFIEIHADTWDYGFTLWVDALGFTAYYSPRIPEGWPQKQRDMWNTGRADFTVPSERLNDSFFDFYLWQSPAPDSPNDGSFGGTQMVFRPGAGPDGADIVAGSYHWPKGIQGMNMATGQVYWSGNPNGGESIGEMTPAFSNSGSAIYLTNDATDWGDFPNGRPLMAFDPKVGPDPFWHNGLDAEPYKLTIGSPKVGPDGRVFAHQWGDRLYGATDDGTKLSLSWEAQSWSDAQRSDPAVFVDQGLIKVVSTGPWGDVYCFDGNTGQSLWQINTSVWADGTPTVDPETGNIYIPAGNANIYLIGLDKSGQPLWPETSMLLYDREVTLDGDQLARSAGCLSHDGLTFYFQSVSESGTGRLFAVNTTDGSLKWEYPTMSYEFDGEPSSPIVTANGVVVVGNNYNNTYFALKDDGSSATLLDTLEVEAGGNARASASISADGTLFLPLRTLWTAYNPPQPQPSMQPENLFCAFSLVADPPVLMLPPPPFQRAVALNHRVDVAWNAIAATPGRFAHYAIFRSDAPFDSVEGMTPIGEVSDIGQTSYTDDSALNGTSYYYAVTSVDSNGQMEKAVPGIGPRTPRDETDLQVVSISRSPKYPRYDAYYGWWRQTDPSGFGPYLTNVVIGVGSGQDASTQRWPLIGQTVTYTATVRNRGTNAWNGSLSGQWKLDGSNVSAPVKTVALAPGDTATFTYSRPWDMLSHEVYFALNTTDSRSANNVLQVDTKSVGFLTYVDTGRMEQFRENSHNYASATTDDYLDWLNHHMARFNEMFAEAGVAKRVRYDLLEVIPDTSEDPGVDRINYAIFPFRYRYNEGDLRDAGYYRAEDDIDYGLLHEMGHQLGLIDLYQLDVSPDANQVNAQGYSAADDLMRTCAPVLSPASALPMQLWLDQAHGYFGTYLYNLPSTIKLRVLGYNGQPLSGAGVKMYQLCERDGIGKVISNQIKAQGTTGADGIWTLPNVPIDPSKAPPALTGDVMHDNPFGYVHVVGTNGVLLFEVTYGGGRDYCWLDITEPNVAWISGSKLSWTFDRQLILGGPVQTTPPDDLTELNASDWFSWVEGGSGTLSDDTDRETTGAGSVKFVTPGGFDNLLRYPRTFTADWDLRTKSCLMIDAYSENENFGYQNASPWIRLRDRDGDYAEYRFWYQDALNESFGKWARFVVPLNAPADADNGWRRTDHGEVDFQHISTLDIHADTWGFGFKLWLDGVSFRSGGPAATSILAAKSSADGTPVSIPAATVSATFETSFNIVSDDRAAGLHIEKWSHERYAGDRVALYGVMATSIDGERFVQLTSATALGSVDPPKPLCITNRNAGGDATPDYNPVTGAGQCGPLGSVGVNNIGQFVRAAGLVTYLDPGGQSLVIWDGSAWTGQVMTDGQGHDGIYVDAYHSVPYQLQEGDYVTVLGVVTCRKVGGVIYPALRVYNIVQEALADQ